MFFKSSHCWQCQLFGWLKKFIFRFSQALLSRRKFTPCFVVYVSIFKTQKGDNGHQCTIKDFNIGVDVVLVKINLQVFQALFPLTLMLVSGNNPDYVSDYNFLNTKKRTIITTCLLKILNQVSCKTRETFFGQVYVRKLPIYFV